MSLPSWANPTKKAKIKFTEVCVAFTTSSAIMLLSAPDRLYAQGGSRGPGLNYKRPPKEFKHKRHTEAGVIVASALHQTSIGDSFMVDGHLIDTGSKVTLIPRGKLQQNPNSLIPKSTPFTAANRTPIKIYWSHAQLMRPCLLGII